MQDIKEREFRDSGLIANNKIYFEVRATALRPRLHTEGFSLYVHTGPPTQGTSQIQIRSSQLLSPIKLPLHKRQGTTTITHTRGIRH